MIVDPKENRWSRNPEFDYKKYQERMQELKESLLSWMNKNEITVSEWKQLQQEVQYPIDAAVNREKINVGH